MQSVYDPNSEVQKEAAEIEAYMRANGLTGYYETENSEIWGYIDPLFFKGQKMYPHKPYPIRRQYAKLKGSLWRCDLCTIPPVIVEFNDMINHLSKEHGMLIFGHTYATQYFTKMDDEKNI